MGGLIRLILILAIAVGGYWAYYVFFASNAHDEIGVAINSYMPLKVREYGCAELHKRHGAATVEPAGCEKLWGVPNP